MKFQNIFLIISLLISSCLTIEEEDLIDLTDYNYPKNTSKSPYYIPILSTNDLHGGIFPNFYSDINKQKYSNGGGNYLYSYKKILSEEWGNKLIWLDAGDQFQGTMECMLSDGLIMKDYYNEAGLQGIALGNHEFDFGIEYLKDFIKKQANILPKNIKHQTPSSPFPIPKKNSTRENFSSKPLIGLQNVGATCYMNATLQCLCNIEKFIDYFNFNDRLNEIVKNDNKNNK